MDERLTPSDKHQADARNPGSPVGGEDVDRDQRRQQQTGQRREVEDAEGADPGGGEENHRHRTARPALDLQGVGDIKNGDQRRRRRGDLPATATGQVDGEHRARGNGAEGGEVDRPVGEP